VASERDLDWMAVALAEADQATLHADVPIGCVVVSASGDELSRDHNRREALADPTAHAEVLALKAAAARLGTWRLEGATVYSTLEPCPMCAGALVLSRIARLVYAARDPKAGAIDSLFTLGTDSRLNHTFVVEREVLVEQSRQRLSAFFRALRAEGQK
jgi:tRNA(adenine34) deaminase